RTTYRIRFLPLRSRDSVETTAHKKGAADEFFLIMTGAVTGTRPIAILVLELLGYEEMDTVMRRQLAKRRFSA
ncbi:MAG: hypothetical protein ACTJHY_05750, partial [Alcaligenes pakistanensis]